MSGVGPTNGLQRTPSQASRRTSESANVPANTSPVLQRTATPPDMPQGRTSPAQGQRSQPRTELPPSRRASNDAILPINTGAPGTNLEMVAVGRTAAVPQPPHTVESTGQRQVREGQEQAQQQLVAYSRKAAAAHAIAQNGVAVAGNTLTTFGVGVTAGDQGASDLVGEHSKLIQGLLKDYAGSPRLQAAAKGAQLGAGWVAGGALGAVASVFGQVVASPVLTAIAQSIGGTQAKFDKVPPEHLVPDPDPGKYADPAAYQAACRNVADLRTAIAEQQGQYGINSGRGVAAGSASFGAGHAARAGTVRHTDLKASLGARVGYGSAASGGAGFMTGAALAAMQATATVSVDVNGERHDLPLFTASQAPVDRLAVLKTIVGSVEGAAKKFSPNGLSLQDIAKELAVQLPLRTAGIMGATAVNYGLRTGGAALNAKIGDDPTKNGAVDASVALLAFVCAVGFWFHALPAIQGIHPSKRPDPALPADEEAAVGHEDAAAGHEDAAPGNA